MLNLATSFPSNCVSHNVSPTPLPIPQGPPPTSSTSVTPPSVLNRPNLPDTYAVDPRSPYGPFAISSRLEKLGSGNSLMTTAMIIRPILFTKVSVNHRFPSDPLVIPKNPSAVGPNSVILPETSI